MNTHFSPIWYLSLIFSEKEIQLAECCFGSQALTLFIKFQHKAKTKNSYYIFYLGEHGRLKYSPPDGFSPLYDSLLPTQILAIDPCFYFGEVGKGVLAGPLPVEDDVAYIPQPVDTSMVSVLCKDLKG